MQNPKRAALIILDGWGINNNAEVSAIEAANTPFMDGLMAKYPNSTLVTYGESVGLPEGQMGNSEVGHINIGAGRIVYQELARINKEIREGNFQKNKVLLETLDYAINNNKKLHLFGLLSDGGVHSHLEHLKAICALTDEHGLDNVFIHLCLDGRDTDPKKGVEYLTDLQNFNKDKKVRIASLIGRYYAMDRDLRWERIKKAYDLLVHGIGDPCSDPVQALKNSYQNGITDEFIMPHFFADENGNPLAKIEAGDALICYNFRTDRCRQITMALTQQDYPEFNMYKIPLHFCTMTRYDEKFKGIDVVYEKEDLSDTIGEVLSKAGKTQIRIAETEKYPHVTFFFNGGREEPFPGEKRIIVPSPKVATYDLKPEMSAIEVTESISKELYESPPDFLCLNYANADMVGHTGVFTAAVKAVETVDDCLSKLVPILLEKNYDIIIIADHGNSDCMKNPDGSPNTAHTTNPVPCVYVSDLKNHFRLCNGKLADIAPTILEILNINKPKSMSGENLIK
jgi:2,3-bisphosphoglycerate-independent phosphoglycerate mutase